MKKFIALALAVGMTFTNSILAGETLVRDSIKSENYVAGVSGWSINRDGTAEFSDLVSRGSLIAGPNPGTHIEINGDDYPGQIALFSGNANESQPGLIKPVLGGANYGATTIQSPVTDGTTTSYSYLELDGFDDGHSTAELQADTLRLNGADNVIIFSDTGVSLGDTTSGGDLVVDWDANDFKARIRNQDEVWNNIPRVNSWVDFAGARANYFKDATGRVQLRGQVASGTAALIGTLAAGNRPTQTMEWIMRGVGGVVMCAVTVSTSGAITVTANVGTAQASGIRLDSISFPTF